MNFIEVIDDDGDRPISIAIRRIEIFYPIVKLDKTEAWLPMNHVECGTKILLKSGRKVSSSMLYEEFKEKLLACNLD